MSSRAFVAVVRRRREIVSSSRPSPGIVPRLVHQQPRCRPSGRSSVERRKCSARVRRGRAVDVELQPDVVHGVVQRGGGVSPVGGEVPHAPPYRVGHQAGGQRARGVEAGQAVTPAGSPGEHQEIRPRRPLSQAALEEERVVSQGRGQHAGQGVYVGEGRRRDQRRRDVGRDRPQVLARKYPS